MSKLLDNLEAILKHMAGLYARLLKCAESKRDAIIAGDIASLESILSEEYELLDKVRKAESVRVTLSGQVEDLCRIPQSERPAKLNRLIASIGEPAQGLVSAQSQIKEVVEKFRYRNRQNEELLKASISHVNDFMNMIKERAGRNKTYNKAGRDYSGGLSLIDRRA